MDVTAGRTVGRYRILQELSEGGGVRVYKAEDPHLRRTVALKLLPREAKRDQRARLLREAKAASVLDHPNVATVYEIGEHQGGLFLATAYHEGETLRDRLDRGPIPEDEALAIAIQVARGLTAVHGTGTVHPDIRPSNLFVTVDGTIKILDFGLAGFAHEDRSRESSTLRAFPYRAPERLDGGAFDHRSDVWSLGVVLHEMLTGGLPFEETTTPPPPARPGNDTPLPAGQVARRFRPILAKSLAVRPDDRFADMASMLAALERARKASPSKKLAPVVLLLLVAGAAAFWSSSREPVSVDARHDSRRIAVLPLENLTGSPDNDYLAEGFSEDLTRSLSQREELEVIARSSTVQASASAASLGEIATSLEAGTILEGSLHRSTETLEMTVRMVDGNSEELIWSESYTRDRDDLASIRNEVSRRITETLSIEASDGAVAVDPRAHREYLVGRFFWNKRTPQGFERAIEHFEKAARLDPNYAAPHGALAETYFLLMNYRLLSTTEALGKARAAALEALSLDASLATAHNTHAAVLYVEGDVTGAEREYLAAMAFDPSYSTTYQWYAIYLYQQRRFDEAVETVERAVELDPLSLVINALAGRVYFFADRHDDAEKQLRRVIDMNPRFAVAYVFLGDVYLLTGRHEEAVQVLEKAVELPGPNDMELWLACAYEVAGREGEARTLLDEILSDVETTSRNPYRVAVFYSLSGDVDEAFRWLQRAVDARDMGAHDLGIDPFLDPLRSDPRFDGLMNQTGLAP